MGNRLYVGNLTYSTTTDDLKRHFGPDVTDAIVIIDRDSGQSKGFGFVTLVTEEAAQDAIEKWNDVELDGRPLRVNVAHERERRPRQDFNGPPPEPRGGESRGRDRKGRNRQRRHEDRHNRDY